MENKELLALLALEVVPPFALIVSNVLSVQVFELTIADGLLGTALGRAPVPGHVNLFSTLALPIKDGKNKGSMPKPVDNSPSRPKMALGDETLSSLPCGSFEVNSDVSLDEHSGLVFLNVKKSQCALLFVEGERCTSLGGGTGMDEEEVSVSHLSLGGRTGGFVKPKSSTLMAHLGLGARTPRTETSDVCLEGMIGGRCTLGKRGGGHPREDGSAPPSRVGRRCFETNRSAIKLPQSIMILTDFHLKRKQILFLYV